MPRLSKIGAAALAAFGWTGLSSVSASYLVVAGGGGASWAGGGGAGGYRTGTTSLNPTLSYTVTVGAGGAQVVSGVGNNGSDSVFSTITSSGGGYGRYNTTAQTAGSGGSGGGIGGGTGQTAGSGNTPSTSPSQGNNGGTGDGSGGGGGGGAFASGSIGSSTGGAGGAGSANSISGTSVTYAGGGGGGGSSAGGAGGAGGGGTGSTTVGTAGTANLGGGGGGGWNTNGGNGGSGVVIISYVGAQQFGGGVVTVSGGSTIHTFTTSGTLSPLSSLTASYLIVAGGGGGGGSNGGGGAGGLLSGSSLTIDTNSIYAVTVGAGGTAAGSSAGGNGGNSSFSMVSTTAVGGGGGGFQGGTTTGASGGSGGGGSYPSSAAGGAGTAGQGNAGGSGAFVASQYGGGGGGGAGAVGANGTGSGGGNGGAGTASSISGSSVTYAGGGGGGADTASAGTGGAGGGGAGGINSGVGTAGTANLGGGGGGGAPSGAANTSGGAGGSGVVIISYAGSTQQMAGGTVTVAGGNVIHTFTSSGYLTPIVLVTNSLRFRSSASAYLQRTPTSAATSRRIMTYSVWAKIGTLGTQRLLYEGYTSVSDFEGLVFNTSDQLEWTAQVNGGTSYGVRTPAVFRDPSAWYHIVCAVDTTQATSTNRVRIYVNGVEQTGLTTFYSGFPAQNTDLEWNNQSSTQVIGWGGHFGYYDGYMTEINMIDGQQLSPFSFGTTSDLGVWQPIRYGGSYGTNGFYLPFPNSGAVTANYLVVAGGGGGGIGGGGGGGGAGGLRSTVTATGGGGSLESALTLNAGNSYTVTVGAGGAGGVTEALGTSGSNSVFSTITSTGGGGGSYASSTGASPLGSGALTGGSGGGGSAWRNSLGTTSTQSNAAGTANQGFAGGSAGTQTTNSIGTGGGGGGAGAVGVDTTVDTSSGAGGAGVSVAITGSSVPYGGGGGGGGSNASAGTGGSGGGGNGTNGGSGSSGTANLGGGGGGGYSGTGGSGGSGVVIISYSGTPKFTGGIVSQVGGNTIHTFTTSGTLAGVGSDYSPNGNNWTPNNFSFSSGSTYDSMTDVPTLTSATAANYCVWNPLNVNLSAGSIGLSDGNLTKANNGNGAIGTILSSSDKYYCEIVYTAISGTVELGVCDNEINLAVGYKSDGTKDVDSFSTNSAYGSSYTTNDVIGIALDATSKTVTFYKNNVSQGAVSYTRTGNLTFFATGRGAATYAFVANFGQQPFSYTPPANFVRLNTFNLPTPTIGATASTTANKYFDATTYAGNNTSGTNITNSGSFQPDFVWIKNRTGANNHILTDAVRGATKTLFSDATSAETTVAGALTAFNSNGFQVGYDTSAIVNASSNNYVGWQWRASNTTPVTNTQGSITSTVSASTTAGFSIVTYSGNGTSGATIGHGLGVTPSMVIIKGRNASTGASEWVTQHQSLSGGVSASSSTFTLSSYTSVVYLSGTYAAGAYGFDAQINGASGTYVAYCFAQVAGYSAFGSYTGNGSTDGPFIFTGFRPRFLIVKRTSDIGSWIMTDSARSTYNVTGELFNANTSGAEFTTNDIKFDYLSNGFKLREVNGAINASGSTYIYMAFAENPFKYANAR